MRFFILFFLFSLSANAVCLRGDALMEKKNYEKAEMFYEQCAISNDADAQYKLGILYRDGLAVEGASNEKALAYFRFAAENGHAAAQTALAKMILSLENQGDEGQKTLIDYQKQVAPSSRSILGRNSRDTMSAYAWLLLAAERADNKWFYPAGQTSDAVASKMINDHHTGNTSYEEAVEQASEWKQKKLMQAAQSILSANEYRVFESAIKNPDQQTEALDFLRYRINSLQSGK